MTDVDPPWWSSGVAPGAGAAPGPAADDRARREQERQRFERARAGHERSEGGGRSGPGHGHTAGAADATGVPPSHDGDVCQVCPICTAMRLVGEVRPELLVHLSEAARHLTLAAKTVVDAHASGFGGGGLERIPLDDDDVR